MKRITRVPSPHRHIAAALTAALEAKGGQRFSAPRPRLKELRLGEVGDGDLLVAPGEQRKGNLKGSFKGRLKGGFKGILKGA